MIQIYLRPADRRKQPGILGFFATRPLYRELVDAAVRDGLLHAQAHHMHYGYNNHGKIRAQDPELGNAELTICVELIGARTQLDTFCRAYGDLLSDKVIIYKSIEQWDIHSHEADALDAPSISRSAMATAVVT
jgi:hypothetical protein